MGTIHIQETDTTITDADAMREFLADYGIWYRRYEGGDTLDDDATNEAILAAYDEPIQELMRTGGYVTADVINVTPETPGLDAMLNKFNKEHWHDEDEVRFIVKGSGLFHINMADRATFSIELQSGDLINVPKGTHHWFHLCEDRTIRAIRLFQDPSGWTPHYTESGEDAKFLPSCFGPAFLSGQGAKATPLTTK